MYSLLAAIFAASIYRVLGAPYLEPIYPFKSITAPACHTYATAWVNNEDIIGDMIHIIGGTTRVIMHMTGLVTDKCFDHDIVFISIG